MARTRKPMGPTVGTVQKLGPSGASVLSHVPLFAGLAPRDLRRMASLMEEVWFAPGRVLVEEGKPGTAFYVILDGEARIVRGKSGRTIMRLGPGHWFGEMSLLDGGPRTATVIAETSLDAIRIKRSEFRKMVLKEPEVGLRLMVGLAGRIRQYERQLVRDELSGGVPMLD